MANQTIHTPVRGFTAFELIIVLVIGLSIIALSASKMGELFGSSKTTQAVSNILELAAAVSEMKAAGGIRETDVIKELAATDTLPRSVVKTSGTSGSTTTLDGVWGDKLKLEADLATQVATLTYPKVPQAACNKLIKNFIRNDIFKVIKVASAPLTSASSAANITKACTPATSATAVNLAFTM